MQENGVFVKQDCKLKMVLFFDIKSDRFYRLLAYTDLLHQKHKANGLGIDVVLPSTRTVLNELKSKLYLAVNLIPDTTGVIYKLFDVRYKFGEGLLALDQSNHVKFVLSGIPPENTLRQLIEVGVFGSSRVTFDFDERFHELDFFELPLIDHRNQKKKSLCLM